MNTDSDFSLILCQGHTGPATNWVHTNTFSNTACLFPEIKGTHIIQMKDQQLHNDTYRMPSTMSHDNKLKANMQEAADNDSSTDVSVHSGTGVGLGKIGITSQVNGTGLINKATNPCVMGLTTSSAQVLRPSSKTVKTLNLDQNQLQNSYSDFICDLADPQELVEMELKEKKKRRSLDKTEELALNIHT